MNKIAVREDDYLRLSALAKAVRTSTRPERANALDERLRKALIFTGQEWLGKVVVMDSMVTLIDPDDGESYTYQLVFPSEADISQGRISVLTPLGAALLGRREGESFTYESPGGSMNAKVERVETLELEPA
ncbi:nucleoside diphosphate kinase regulator [Treponema sp.]